MALPLDNSSTSTSNEQEYEESQTRSNYIDDEQEVVNKRDVYQRTAWNKLHVSIGYLVYKVNAVNIGIVKKKLLQQNMIRGNEMFCTFIIQAQQFSNADTHVYATLVAVINLVLPEVGDLVLKRCIKQFKRAYSKNELSGCLASVLFIGHLVNQNVADGRVAVELLWFFFNNRNILSIKIALLIWELCGKNISQGYRHILKFIFENFHNLLNNEQLDEEVKYDLKLLLELKENGFKFQRLDLLPANESQIAHYTSLISVVETAIKTIGYRYDPEFESEEKKYDDFILKSQGHDSEEESESESETDYNDQYDGEKKLIEAMNYIYDIQNDINILSLRKICLKKMIDSTYMEVNYSKLAYHIVKHFHGPINVDLCFMILDCCCEHTVYINHFGLLTQELCKTDKSFMDIVEITFIHCYITSDSFHSHKSNIIANYFAHLSCLGLIPCKLSAILGEESIYPNSCYFKQFFKNLYYFKFHPK